VQLQHILVNQRTKNFIYILIKQRSFLGLGISATKAGNNFNIKVLTGMKSFSVKGIRRKQTNVFSLILISKIS
jgi:hypothetical protein